MITNCLTYDQLQAYSTHTSNKVERSHLYMHISSCELCACAVNGFATIPFASDELVAIHRTIDSKTNATTAGPLTFARVIIVIISFLSIAVVYLLADHSSSKKAISQHIKIKTSSNLIPVINEKKTASPEEISSVSKTYKKIVRRIQYKRFERKIIPNEKLSLIEPLSIRSLNISDYENSDLTIITPNYSANTIYIYDLKISDYNKLYFDLPLRNDNFLNTHTPVSRENKESRIDEFAYEQPTMASDRVLKTALASFNKQEFNIALANFNLLLERNRNDVNAQFYSGLIYYNLNNSAKTIDRFNAVMENNNNAFYPEAQWYLALVNLKTGDKESAKKQLQKIVSEKGFYSKNALQKLKGL